MEQYRLDRESQPIRRCKRQGGYSNSLAHCDEGFYYQSSDIEMLQDQVHIIKDNTKSLTLHFLTI